MENPARMNSALPHTIKCKVPLNKDCIIQTQCGGRAPSMFAEEFLFQKFIYTAEDKKQ